MNILYVQKFCMSMGSVVVAHIHMDSRKQATLQKTHDNANQKHVCCSVLHCVLVCCSVLQCVAVCCSVWECDLFLVQCLCGTHKHTWRTELRSIHIRRTQKHTQTHTGTSTYTHAHIHTGHLYKVSYNGVHII